MDHGNLAYKYEESFRQPQRRPEPRRRKKPQKRERAVMLYKMKYLRRIAAVVVLALAAGFMISKFVAVNETQSRIESLQSELAQIQATNSQMVFELEQSVDLSQIEKRATEELGMQRPEKYQTIYVNLSQGDSTEQTAGEVESFSVRVSKMFENIKENIIEFFSIK